MFDPQKFRRFIFGAPLDPLDPKTRHHIALIAFLAWVGLGADGLSSSCYGPEEAFVALGEHTHLSLYLAAATALTVFIISIAYNQVIELFPSGGGGYKVATRLLGARAGLVSGAALLVDYVLTIAISVASGMDALFSLLPISAQAFKLATEIALVAALIGLNLRGMKEAIAVLLPIFLGFFVTHLLLIVYGVYAHVERLPALVADTLSETGELSRSMGWLFVAALFLRAYSLGGGTYTGLEAVSNSVNMLAEPRVRNGKWTMLYMALSLSFTAGGIILLYLLWDARPAEGRTLNAVAFETIFNGFQSWSPVVRHGALITVLALEAGLLLVAANTGFLSGPAVLSNMAVDSWVPRHFRDLSSRLVRQNGVVLMGAASLAILIWTRGAVALLVVLYSINVFLTFSMSLLGLCVHWIRRRREEPAWRRRLALSFIGLAVTGGILIVTTVAKFGEGGWVTVVITGVVIAACLFIRRHYEQARAEMRNADELLAPKLKPDDGATAPPLDPSQATAIIFVGKHRGIGVHALLWIVRLFPGHFRNFVFLGVGEVDAEGFAGEGALRTLRYQMENSMRYFVAYCHRQGFAAEYAIAFSTDPVEAFVDLAQKAFDKYPNSVCFASKLIFARSSFLTRWLHNHTPLVLQERLHLLGRQMVLLPMKVG
ncbi:MAG TPA: APC family permease [Burkholderiales bacterium]|nr:APC family permease [Burkholderiales bacterium]